ncbi:sensor histidine kinase [Streptomyces longispororuber]|uniref:sensor histidine kinase n=1 Tax=Streptomyces longispororuber TaxID=68230 RepID=UPI0036FD0B3A
MSWTRGVSRRLREWRAARAAWRAEWPQRKAAWRECRRADREDPLLTPGPPNGFALLPWLLMGLGAFSHLLQGRTANPWIATAALLAFNSLYVAIAFRAFDRAKREARSTLAALGALGLLAVGLAAGYGGSWLMFLPLFGLAVGAVVRGRRLGPVSLALSTLAGAVAGIRDGWDGLNIAYGTFLSTMVTAAILSLSEAVRDLRAAREELARRAVAEERLRFSRDLHDLLGHTLSVVVVKSEAARRLAPRDLDAALGQIADIETVGRQALTEIREAVTGYREASLAAELDRARDLLDAAGVETAVRQSGPPLDPRPAALLGWVVREAVTNVVRHARAARCTIEVTGTAEQTRLVIADDGRGVGSTPPGSGLKGLAERIAAAGGSLESGPGPRGGFRVTAVVPSEGSEAAGAGTGPGRAAEHSG